MAWSQTPRRERGPGAGQQGSPGPGGFTHTEVNPSSSDGKSQGALLFYGPEDLGERSKRAGTAAETCGQGPARLRGGQRCLRRCPWWGAVRDTDPG